MNAAAAVAPVRENAILLIVILCLLSAAVLLHARSGAPSSASDDRPAAEFWM